MDLFVLATYKSVRRTFNPTLFQSYSWIKRPSQCERGSGLFTIINHVNAAQFAELLSYRTVA